MFFGKVLRIFAATLVLTSSISFAEGNGDQDNLNAPLESAPSRPAPLLAEPTPTDLPIEHYEYGGTLPTGEFRQVSVDTIIGNSAEDLKAAEKYAGLLATNAEALGGHIRIVSEKSNPEAEKVVAKIESLLVEPQKLAKVDFPLQKNWGENVLGKMAQIAQDQIKVDPHYGKRWNTFLKAYYQSAKGFGKKLKEPGVAKEYFGFSIERLMVGTSAPMISFVFIQHIPVSSAFWASITFGLMSFAYSLASPFLIWNFDLPKPSETLFWKSLEIIAKSGFWFGTEGLFLEAGATAMNHQNQKFIEQGRGPIFKVESNHDLWFDTGKVSTETQGGTEVTTGYIVSEGNKEAAELRKNGQEEAAKLKERQMHRLLMLRSTIFSNICVFLATSQAASAKWATYGFSVFKYFTVGYAGYYLIVKPLFKWYFKDSENLEDTKKETQIKTNTQTSSIKNILNRCRAGFTNLKLRLAK